MKAYWRYMREAKGRHGIHSPFVYKFIEEGLKGQLPKTGASSLVLQKLLLRRCLIYFSCDTLTWQDTPGLNALAEAAQERNTVKLAAPWPADFTPYPIDCFLIDAEASLQTFFESNVWLLEKQCLFIVAGIHDTDDSEVAWQQLCADSRVNLSIDLWHLGLLLYKPEIKEKQHFVLKWAP